MHVLGHIEKWQSNTHMAYVTLCKTVLVKHFAESFGTKYFVCDYYHGYLSYQNILNENLKCSHSNENSKTFMCVAGHGLPLNK